MFHKVDRFIRDYKETQYLALFRSEKYDAIFNRIRYQITLKSSISYVVSHNYGEMIDAHGDLTLKKKTLTLHIAVILIESVFNKNQTQYYYNIYS